MSLVHTIATHTGGAAVEDRRVDGIESIFAPGILEMRNHYARVSSLPIPIRLVSLVATLISKCLFICVCEIAMP